jgi:hypothetical protein
MAPVLPEFSPGFLVMMMLSTIRTMTLQSLTFRLAADSNPVTVIPVNDVQPS